MPHPEAHDIARDPQSTPRNPLIYRNTFETGTIIFHDFHGAAEAVGEA
jgi:hypothetical protein